MRRGVVGSVFVSFAMAIFYAGAVAAAPTNVWQSSQDFNVTEYSAPQTNPRCIAFPARVMQQDGTAEAKPVCAEYGANLSLGTFTDDDGAKRYAIKIGTDSVYRQIGNISAKRNHLYLRADNNTIIVKTTGSGVSPRMYALRLEDGAFSPEKSDTGLSVWEYNVDHSKRVPLLGVENNGATQYRFITGYDVSDDRAFVVAWVDYQVVVLVDTETFEERVIGRENGSQYGGFYNPRPAAVSDDGRYVFFAHTGVVYDTLGCGDAYEYRFSEKQFVINNPCDRTELAGVINPLVHYPKSKFDAAYRFIDDGNALQIDYPEEKPTVRYHVETTAYQPHQLEYLALGDSYSSGEGDTEEVVEGSGVKWYRNWTDNNEDSSRNVPEEKCHISPRSYPYLLARDMGLKMNSEWQTVACSGATAWDVKAQGSVDYLGQSSRLEGYDVGTLKAIALNEFIPGRNKQIEFVKKYQPKVITLTMGGNDVDFGPRIRKCTTTISTCEIASFAERSRLKEELRNQFENLSSLYSEILRASPGAQLYVLGYPQFINADPRATCTNTLFLNASEREMIVNSIVYLNNIIEVAARSTGAIYVETENALKGHRLCDENDKHVTAITGYKGYGGNDISESFHPNHHGNEDMAVSSWVVLSESLANDSNNATAQTTVISADLAVAPPYFAVESREDDERLVYYKLTNGTLVVSDMEYSASSHSYTYLPDSKVELWLYSEPTKLGVFDVYEDGSVDARFTLPIGVPYGYHTLVMRGLSYSGEPIDSYQTVELLDRQEDKHEKTVNTVNEELETKAEVSMGSTDTTRIISLPDKQVIAQVQGTQVTEELQPAWSTEAAKVLSAGADRTRWQQLISDSIETESIFGIILKWAIVVLALGVLTAGTLMTVSRNKQRRIKK